MKYPIGIQTFDQLIEHGFVYVDKTDMVYSLATEGKIYFLSRPRRFGKSLLLSTLKAYFEGKKQLFKGLKIDALEKDWHPHRVFHFDFNGVNFTLPGALEANLEGYLTEWKQEYGITPGVDFNLGSRFEKVLKAAAERSGRGAVVLVDEYDKPLLDVLEQDEELLNRNRETLKAFYSTFKRADASLRFVFLTIVASDYLHTHKDVGNLAQDLAFALEDGEPDTFRKQLTAFLASIPYSMHRKDEEPERERYFQYTFYLLLRLMSIDTVFLDKEQSQGRVDCIVETPDYVYIFEFKLDGTARKAMQQIEEKGYARPYATDPRKVCLIGANFSSETGTLDDWESKAL